MGVAYVHFGVEGYLYDRAALVVVRFLFVEDERNGPFDNDEVDIRVAVVDGDRIAFSKAMWLIMTSSSFTSCSMTFFSAMVKGMIFSSMQGLLGIGFFSILAYYGVRELPM